MYEYEYVFFLNHIVRACPLQIFRATRVYYTCYIPGTCYVTRWSFSPARSLVSRPTMTPRLRVQAIPETNTQSYTRWYHASLRYQELFIAVARRSGNASAAVVLLLTAHLGSVLLHCHVSCALCTMCCCAAVVFLRCCLRVR